MDIRNNARNKFNIGGAIKIQRLLCLLGKHVWDIFQPFPSNPEITLEKCKYCPKIK